MENNSRQKTNTREGAAGPGLDDEGIGLDILDFQDNLPFYVMLVDEDHRILQANKAVRSQLGVGLKGALKVVTTQLRAGYLRKNGVPYSENALLTEYFSRVSAVGNDYLTVLTVVHDPAYLVGDFITSSQFKREPDAAKWNPTPCSTAPPRAPAAE